MGCFAGALAIASAERRREKRCSLHRPPTFLSEPCAGPLSGAPPTTSLLGRTRNAHPRRGARSAPRPLPHHPACARSIRRPSTTLRGNTQGALPPRLRVEAVDAVTKTAIGTLLGLLLAWNIVQDTREQPSWENLTLVVPWGNLVVIYVVVYAVAMAATLAPALRAARIRPAEALRYQ